MGALDDRVILVTGGSRGIGAAVARAVAAAGADVALGFLTDADRAAAVGREVEALGRAALTVRADVSRRSEVDALVAATLERFGRIDGLVNNAGVMPESPFLEIDDEEWERVMRTDLFGAFYTCQAVLPQMLERGSGSIVNVASRLGQIGFAGVAHYATAKAALIGLTKSLAREFGPRGIRVNAVAPGVTLTDMGSQVTEGEVGRRRQAELPLGRFGQPEEVASAVEFLLSDASVLFLGQTLNPNAGGYMP
jgi:3-oxoacyl-[acyl-carrier protein] reductase